jgi:hypothetical protein
VGRTRGPPTEPAIWVPIIDSMLNRRVSARADVNRQRSLLIATSRALALYGFAAWVYVALVALIHPQTLSLQLTHLTKWPRTDTFGEISFVVSFVAFWLHTLLRQQPELSPPPADRENRA